MPDFEYCGYQMYAATLEQPAEFCDLEVEEGSEYCILHEPGDEDDDPFIYDDEPPANFEGF